MQSHYLFDRTHQHEIFKTRLEISLGSVLLLDDRAMELRASSGGSD
jgi:hypothetical protein